jgi:dephospho-CoA kinase
LINKSNLLRNRMKKIGITGGIGSGKTIVCEVFRLMGVPVFHADNIARDLQQNDSNVRNALIELLGKDIYNASGILNRENIARMIFNDKELLAKVNQIIHPAVRENFRHWVVNHIKEKYILYEAAILFESGYYKELDLNILILADEDIRVKRVIKRDNISEQSVRERIKNQMPDQEKIRLADYIIENNEKQLIIPQVLELDKLFRSHDKIG